jgi:hypothetical protein
VSEPRDLRDLTGADLEPEELERLQRVDSLLRSVPAPATVPPSLTRAVADIPAARTRRPTPRRLAVAAALAAALSALFFGLGRWTGDNGESYRFSVSMRATEKAPGATALIRVGERDAQSGNWRMELEVSGLPKLSENRYYAVWLAKDGEYAATCGTFNVGPGTTTVEFTVSYRLTNVDTWVITETTEDAPWLLSAPVPA